MQEKEYVENVIIYTMRNGSHFILALSCQVRCIYSTELNITISQQKVKGVTQGITNGHPGTNRTKDILCDANAILILFWSKSRCHEATKLN